MHRWVNINIDVFMEKILKENQVVFVVVVVVKYT